MQLFCQTCTNPTHYWIRKVPAVISNEIPSEWKAAIFSELQAQIVYKSDGAIAFVFCQQAAWRCGCICLFADTAAIWKSDKRCVTANNAPSEISTAKKRKKKNSKRLYIELNTRGGEHDSNQPVTWHGAPRSFSLRARVPFQGISESGAVIAMRAEKRLRWQTACWSPSLSLWERGREEDEVINNNTGK